MNILQLNTEKETIKFKHVTYVNSDKVMYDIRTALSTLFYVPKGSMLTLRSCMPEVRVLHAWDNCSVDIEYCGAELTCNIKAGKNGKPLYSGFKNWFNEFYRLFKWGEDIDCPLFAFYEDSVVDVMQYENAAIFLKNYCYLGWDLASSYIKNMQRNIKNEWLDWYRENKMLQHSTQDETKLKKRVSEAHNKIKFYEGYLKQVTEGMVQGLYVRPTSDLKDDELVLKTEHGYLEFDELYEYKDMVEITLDLAYRQLKSKSPNGIIMINKKVRGIERIINAFPQYQFIINEK